MILEKDTMKAIDYAEAGCRSMMRKFSAEDLPPKGRFHYHQGVFLSGMYQCYELTQKQCYFDYIKAWVDSIINEKGEIHSFCPDELDDIQPGILLFPLVEKTGDPRYDTALKTLMEILKHWKKNEVGGYWHKEECANEMWLDGLYMGGSIQVQLAKRYHDPELMDAAAEQAVLMYRYTRDPKTGLLYHAYAGKKEVYWADPKTGLAPEFWGRALGWFLVASLDILEYLPQEHRFYEEIKQAFIDTAKAVISFQDDASGMWYQVVDKGQCADNWLESSCTALFTYAILRGIRAGYLPEQYLQNGERGYRGLIQTVKFEDGELVLDGICVGTCVGDYNFYVQRPTCANDLHGMGAFLLMCSERARCTALGE